jgi:hypothetical protein
MCVVFDSLHVVVVAQITSDDEQRGQRPARPAPPQPH